MTSTKDRLETLLAGEAPLPYGEDRCKIQVIRRLRTVPTEARIAAFFGDCKSLGPKHAWYVGAWDGNAWRWCQCDTHRVASHLAKAVSARARRNAGTTGLWEPAEALEKLVREWTDIAEAVADRG